MLHILNNIHQFLLKFYLYHLKTDGYYLKYEASTGKFVGSAVTVSGGSQTLDQTLSFGNTSSLGMSVGVLTATSFIGDGSQITGISTFSGNYNDLTNKPSIPTDTGDLTNSVGFVTSGIVVGYATEGYVNNLVAISTFSRDYNDLTNKPTTLSSFTNDVGFITSYTETSNLDDILGRGNSSSLGMSVGVVTATSFDGDLTGNSDTSTYALRSGVSTVSEGLTGIPSIIVNSITAADASFSGNVSIAGTLTYEDVTSVDSLGIITARSGIFVGPVTSIGSTIDSFGNASFLGIVTASSFSGITTSMVVGLSTVSSTGSYNDLKDKPTIPTDTADLTNSVGFVTSSIVVGYATEGYVNNLVAISTFSGDYNDLTNTPTTLSSFTNDVGFITSYTETSTLNDILTRGNVSGIGISVGLSTFVNNVHIGSATTFTENLVVTGNARVTGILTIGTSSITLDPETGIVSGINEISGNAETSNYATISGISTSVSGGTADVTTLTLPDGLISTRNAILATTNETSIDEFDSTIYRSAKYQIQITRGISYQVTEIFLVHNGSSSYQTEYATISTGETLGFLSTDIFGGNVRLLATPTSNDITTFKLIRTLIEV